jgi:GT2 family glycosyltransferase
MIMQVNNPEVSFITINYNGISDTLQLIQSLKHTIKSLSFEIIVVDNASLKNEAELIHDYYSDVITIRSGVNLGFSGGNNLGISRSSGCYLFFINNDTYIEEDGIKYLIDRLESSSKIAGVSPKIRFAYGEQRIQFAGYLPLSNVTMRNRALGCHELDSGQCNVAAATPYLHGAAMMFKREAIKQVGLMPEIYFLYYEELDWCTQFVREGYELWYEPKSIIFHKESQSVGLQSPLRTFYMTRNRLLYVWRNNTIYVAVFSILYQISAVALKNIIVNIFSFQIDLAFAVIRGIVSFFRLKNKRKHYDWIS